MALATVFGLDEDGEAAVFVIPAGLDVVLELKLCRLADGTHANIKTYPVFAGTLAEGPALDVATDVLLNGRLVPGLAADFNSIFPGSVLTD